MQFRIRLIAFCAIIAQVVGCGVNGLVPEVSAKSKKVAATHIVEISDTAVYVMAQDLKIINEMKRDYPGVEVHVSWEPCGEENGYYNWIAKQVVICAEDLAWPGWSIQVAAHEFGHAVTHQLADILDENAADELAIMAMARHGWLDEMLDAAIYMKTHWSLDHIPGDSHPGAEYRAWELVCAEEAAEAMLDPDHDHPASVECLAFYEGMVIKWDHRIPRVSL